LCAVVCATFPLDFINRKDIICFTGELSVSLSEQYLQVASKQSSSKRSLHVMHYASLLHHRQQQLQQKQLQQQAEEEHQLELHDLHAYDCIMQLNMQQKLELLLHVHECASPQIQVRSIDFYFASV
jgi:hypothetical protein